MFKRAIAAIGLLFLATMINIGTVHSAKADWYSIYDELTNCGGNDFGNDYYDAAVESEICAWPFEQGKVFPTGFTSANSFQVCAPYYSEELCDWGVQTCNAGQISTPYGCVSSVEYPGCNCGRRDGRDAVGQPINVASGNMFETETDFRAVGQNPLTARRFYNSYAAYAVGSISPLYSPNTYNVYYSRFGLGWRSEYDRFIVQNSDNSVDAIRADGEPVHFVPNDSGGWYVAYWTGSGGWSKQTDPRHDIDITLSYDGTYWYIADSTDTTDKYDSTGKLVQVTYRNGYSQTLNYMTGGPACGTDLKGTAVICNTSITDTENRSLTFSYQVYSYINSQQQTVYVGTGLVTSVVATTTAGSTTTFYVYIVPLGAPPPSNVPWGAYVLQQVVFPDATSKTYAYSDPINHFGMTSVTDENNNTYASWTYDSASERATSSQLAGGADLFSISYNDANNTRTVTNGLGKQFIYSLNSFQNRFEISQIAGQASAHTAASTIYYSYDPNGYLQQITSGEDRLTYFTHNSIGEETSRTDGYQSQWARTVSTQWDPNYHVPDVVTEPNVTISMNWPNGLLSQLTETDTTTQSIPYSTNGETRTWNFTYYPSGNSCSPIAGLLESVQGPLGATETTTYCYNTNGFVSSVTNPLGQVTHITAWNGWGQPLTSIDPNGITTQYTYDSRARLKTVTVNPGSSQSETQFGYDNAGNLTSMVFPDNSSLTYGYDPAHRLDSVTNNLNEQVGYQLDALGGRTQTTTEAFVQHQWKISKVQSATFDELERILTELGSAGQLTQHVYDKDNNEISTIDPRNQTYQHGFDAIERVMSEINPDQTSNDPTRIAYNGKDEVTNVTDARTNQTSYVRDGFGDIIQITSPDTGTTVLWYDANGKVTKKVDAQNVETDYKNDVLGRVTKRSIKGTTAETVNYTWDTLNSRTYGIGRLGKLSDPSGSTTLQYDPFGNVTQDNRVIGANTYTTNYKYDAANHVRKMTYPSGMVVTLGRDGFGRIQSVSAQPAGLAPVTIATGSTYEPFGPLNGMLFGNGLSLTEGWDEDYHLSSIITQNGSNMVQNLSYADDPDGNIQTITDNIGGESMWSQSFGYDPVNRLASATGGYGSQSYTYDPVGNRQQVAIGNLVYNYNISPFSNQITSITHPGGQRNFSYWATGQVNSDQRNQTSDYIFSFNGSGRMASAYLGQSELATYTYNGFEQRAIKAAITTTDFLYDEAGHMIAEANDATGLMTREYIWMDNLPVAVVDWSSGSPVVYDIHADHLGRPQKMTDQTGAVQWAANYDPFGVPQGIKGSLTMPLMFPGQYWDSETQLSQNWNRDYDSSIGRYIESDPIGLEGGLPSKFTIAGGLNTYSYVENEPLSAADVSGLGVVDCIKAVEDLNDSTNNLKDRTDKIALYGDNDPGHLKALAQAKQRVQNDLDRVKKYCGCVVVGAAGAAAAIEAAEAAIAAAGEAILPFALVL